MLKPATASSRGRGPRTDDVEGMGSELTTPVTEGIVPAVTLRVPVWVSVVRLGLLIATPPTAINCGVNVATAGPVHAGRRN